jgi:CheY-like chemotaxis protein/nitrogen-specific signal transduction histidine kinase
MPKTTTSAAKRRRQAWGAPRRRPARTASARAIEATLAELAHDIRTPLTGILALAELLATSGLGERERDWAVAIKSTAEHLAMLTSLIVDAARAEAKGIVLRRDLVRPRQLAEALAASLAGRAKTKDLAAEVVLADDLPDRVVGDALRLRAAVENLIDNAVKFTDRGTIRLEVSCEKAARGRLQLTFAVSDSGIGLSPAEIKRLFRPFAQANQKIARRYGGAGLGLALVKRLATAMGGSLTVTSERGGGSRFRFSVTVGKVIGAAPKGHAAAPHAAPGRPLNILCAEDNPYGRVVLNTILVELGHRTDFVATGEAAVEAVARGGYDAVLMDVTLPGIDGLEATRRIRALNAPAGATPIIGISGRANAADKAASRAAGMNGYFVKPLSPSALADLLATLVSRA